ncbi:hypothetical protein [Vibrio metschnikovii]|uniref:hypothetical protein n=1 Tax=Vibrio metschnikovii TaxID=28172 RepID=UPI001C30A743|nr:hypothetical protein [Vibrio metschnikovii]
MKIYKIAILLLLTNLSFISHAATIRGKVTANKVDWIGAIKMPSGELYVPTGWDIINNLEPTHRWIPATHIVSPPKKINLLGTDSQVSASIKIVGLEYNFGNLKPKQSGDSGSCYIMNMDDTMVSLLGDSCRSGLDFIYASRSNPFYFTRPIIEINEKELLRDFEGMESGKYIGSIPLVAYYEYYTDSGALTYRNFSYTFQVELDYQPSHLTSISINGDGVIEPVYDTQTKTVSGKTKFYVNANGYFNNGLKLIFINRSYSLDGPTKIPYSIRCKGTCSANEIVRDGVMINDSIIISEGTSNMRNVDFILDVGYENFNKEQVETGSYNDVISIIFEENL